MSRVPGGWVGTAALAVMMPHLSRALAVACPVPAGPVCLTSKRRAIGLRAGKNVVNVGSVASAIHDMPASVSEFSLLAD